MRFDLDSIIPRNPHGEKIYNDRCATYESFSPHLPFFFSTDFHGTCDASDIPHRGPIFTRIDAGHGSPVWYLFIRRSRASEGLLIYRRNSRSQAIFLSRTFNFVEIPSLANRLHAKTSFRDREALVTERVEEWRGIPQRADVRVSLWLPLAKKSRDSVQQVLFLFPERGPGSRADAFRFQRERKTLKQRASKETLEDFNSRDVSLNRFAETGISVQAQGHLAAEEISYPVVYGN